VTSVNSIRNSMRSSAAILSSTSKTRANS